MVVHYFLKQVITKIVHEKNTLIDMFVIVM